LRGDKILWTGRPKNGLLFMPRNALLIPFSVLWGGFAIFWEYSVLTMRPRFHAAEAHQSAPIIFPIFGLALVCVGLLLIFGRFIVDMLVRRQTIYPVTNQRILFLRSWPGNAFATLNIAQLPTLTL
jgi:hypothetical protein